MKNIVCISVITIWFLGWSAPLLSASYEMGCCRSQQIQKSISTVPECRSHCGEDGCCNIKPQDASDSTQPLLNVKYEDPKSPLHKTNPVLSSSEEISKDPGVRLSRYPTLLLNCQIPSYLKHKHFLI